MAIKVRNLFEETDGTSAAAEAGARSGLAEVFEPIVETSALTVERIISHGAASPKDFWYDQETDEWVMIARGGAVLEFKDEGLVAMKAGDHVMIPRRKKHRVLLTSRDAVWVAMHLRGPVNVKVSKARKKAASKQAAGSNTPPPSAKSPSKSTKKARHQT